MVQVMAEAMEVTVQAMAVVMAQVTVHHRIALVIVQAHQAMVQATAITMR